MSKTVDFSLCPVPILQDELEFATFLKMVEVMRPKKIVEIGSFFGGTLWYFLQLQSVNHFTAIDLPIPATDERYEKMKECRQMWPEWIAARPGLEFHDIQGDSHAEYVIDDVHDLHFNNDVDLLFIDGDHSYNGVSKDFNSYFDIVRPGGYIVLHDIWGIEDVARFWDETKVRFPYPIAIVNSPKGWGIGIIKKP